MGKSIASVSRTANTTKESLENLWKKIEADIQIEYRLDLRGAANLIGFWRFPIGWLWTEYRRILSPLKSYEKYISGFEWIALGKPVGDPTAEGKALSEAAASYRRNEVEAYLKRFILRNEVGVGVFDDDGVGMPFPVDQQFAVSKFNIPVSSIRFHDDMLRVKGCSVDAINLLQVLQSDRRKQKSSGKKAFDWMLVERFIRNRYEYFGFPQSDKVLLSEVHSWYAELFGRDCYPTRSTLYANIKCLREEYSFNGG